MPPPIITLADHRPPARSRPKYEWTLEEVRSIFAPSVKVLPFVTRDPKKPLDGHPLTWWNDEPGIDHKLDRKRGVAYADMLIDTIAADRCGGLPIERIFESIIEDTVARKIKGGKHSRILPPAVDGFLWQLSRTIATKAGGRPAR